MASSLEPLYVDDEFHLSVRCIRSGICWTTNTSREIGRSVYINDNGFEMCSLGMINFPVSGDVGSFLKAGDS